MKVVGLTGGIGSGKSTVAEMFATLGVPIYIADVEAKHLSNTDKELKAEVVELLGERSYRDNEMDRAYVADIVFEDSQKLRQLNAIIHPRVARHFKEWKLNQKGLYCIKEAAILFENGSYKNCDAIILVTAPERIRIERVVARDNTSPDAVKRRMDNQWTESRKRELAHYLIENIDLEKTRDEVLCLHKKLLEKYRKS
ncbi:MAG: dephospho-CoA kinase [Flavobacteriaceae bacterium]|nr:dephospho-CoA kinase [Flavobacteriaceae bacterium]